MDEHYLRLRERVLSALAGNEAEAVGDDELIYVLETTCELLERTYKSIQGRLKSAADDFEAACFALPPLDEGRDQSVEETTLRQELKANARRRARAALGA